MEHYIQRLEALEEVGRAFDGVEKVFAIQAGREIRIMVKPQSIDDVVETLRHLYSVESNALYVLMELPQVGLAIGRQELPKLPSSRRALFATPTATPTTPFIDWVQKKVVLDVVLQGEASMSIGVSKDLVRP